MTSEIVIMSKNAVALAADSIATLYTKTGDKTYSTASKIFELNCHHSIGFMVNNNAAFLGVPWETIMTLYKKESAEKSYAALEDCVDDFIKFLETCHLFSHENQLKMAFAELRYFQEFILYRFEKALIEKFDETSSELSYDEQIAVLRSCLNNLIESTKKIDDYIDCDDSFIEKYFDEIEEILKQYYENIYDDLKIEIIELNKCYFRKSLEEYYTRVVVAGFGCNDLFPKICHINIDRMIENKLYYTKDFVESGDNGHGAAIFPFSQQDTIDTFVCGINTHFKEYIKELIDEFCPEQSKNMSDKIEDFSENNYACPIFSAFNHLPKSELATMAETLIHLTFFNPKISAQPMSMNGPTDVAVISKEEGFVWIKREYYFEASLNYHYIAKYYNLMGVFK